MEHEMEPGSIHWFSRLSSLRGTMLRVPTAMTAIFGGLYRSAPLYANYHVRRNTFFYVYAPLGWCEHCFCMLGM